MACRLLARGLMACWPDVVPDPDDAIAGGLRLVGNDRELLLDEAVEQRGFAGIGAADQCDEPRLHAVASSSVAGTGSRRLIRTRVMRRRCVSTISTSRPSTSMCSPTAGIRPRRDNRYPPTVSKPCPSIGHLHQLRHLVDVHAAAHQELPAPFVDDAFDFDVVFVADLADDLFEQIFNGDQAGGAAVLVDDDRDLHATALKLLEQIRHALGLGHEVRGPHQWRNRIAHAAGRQALDQVLDEDEALHVIQRILEHRHARILLLAEQGIELFDGGVAVDGDDVGPRRHHLADHGFAEVGEVAQQLARLPFLNGFHFRRWRLAPPLPPRRRPAGLCRWPCARPNDFS